MKPKKNWNKKIIHIFQFFKNFRTYFLKIHIIFNSTVDIKKRGTKNIMQWIHGQFIIEARPSTNTFTEHRHIKIIHKH